MAHSVQMQVCSPTQRKHVSPPCFAPPPPPPPGGAPPPPPPPTPTPPPLLQLVQGLMQKLLLQLLAELQRLGATVVHAGKTCRTWRQCLVSGSALCVVQLWCGDGPTCMC